MRGSLAVSTQLNEGVGIVRLDGEVDLSTAPQFEHAVRALAQQDCTLLVVDLANVTFIDSTGLDTLVRANAELTQMERRLVVFEGPEIVRRVFEIMRLDAILTVLPQPVDLARAAV